MNIKTERDCVRFQPIDRISNYSHNEAIIFNKLRQVGTPRKQALQFCTSQHCKIDSSQRKFGPQGHKIFSLENNHNSCWKTVGHHEYKEIATFKYCDDKQWSTEPNDSEDKQKMIQLKEFYTDLDTKYSFQNLSQNEIIQKLRSLSSEESYKNRVPQLQIKDKQKKMIYYEMAEYIYQLKKPQQTLIQTLEAFDDTIPFVKDQNIQIEPKKIEKPTPIYKFKNVDKRSKLLKELGRTYTGRVSVREPTEELKQAIRKSFKVDFNNSHYFQNSPQSGQDSLLSSLNDLETNNSKKIKQRCSVMAQQFSNLNNVQDVGILKFHQLKCKLKEIVKRGIQRMNCEKDSSIF